ncbi:uncharacterized protein LOC129719106 isoform X2 [Wyeomyia smithii]|uniref:uncharacterized protein LOC129719106 isoform X2 n=1 Tax=Wyeomyia smithii TaxID=174621 RepID=UPI002467F971|nr:uncharacterized protein LOC129719106 isoform X2 [Wyeomyia smithii]
MRAATSRLCTRIATGNLKCHPVLASVLLLVLISVLLLLPPPPARVNPQVQLHPPPPFLKLEDTKRANYLWYIRRVCQVQYEDRRKKLTAPAEQLKDNFVTVQHGSGQTLNWCKTFDRSASFAGLDQSLRAFHEATKGSKPTVAKPRIMLVEHPLLRLARFYRDALRAVTPDSPFFVLGSEIQSRSGGVGLPPSFQQFLEFALNDKNRWNPYASYWLPYMTVCEPCLLQYDAVLELDPEWIEDNEKGKQRSQQQQQQQQEKTELRAMYRNVGEKLMERLLDFYRDDLTILAYKADQFYQEVYQNFASEIVQVRPF